MRTGASGRPATVIDIEGAERDRVLRSRVSKLVGEALATLAVEPVKARVTFFDDNGPKGGPAMRCAVEVRVPYRPAIHIEHIDTTNRLAFDGILAVLERQLERYRERDRENRRHPKKYFVAKRLLTGSLAGAVTASTRARRRKSE
jgi:ribosome-associated translation inhibitor RaiA